MTNKNQKLVQQLVSAALFIAAITMLGFLSVRYKAEIDWTAGNRNTLTAASVQQLKAMQGPVTVYAFVYAADESRRSITQDLERYKRAKPDFSIEFIDPAAQPQKAAEYKVQQPGELVLEFQGRRENLKSTAEDQITAALQRLTFAGEQWVVFLEGHGERSIADAQDQAAFSHFAAVLQDKGLKVRGLNLVKTPSIPENTSVLVIAAPQNQLLAGEIKLIDEYAAKGGDLLWLAEPDRPAGLAPLAKTLGIAWQDGFVIDPVAQQLGLPGGFYVPAEYPENTVTRGLKDLTIFPLARSLTAVKDSGWQAQDLLKTVEGSWLETGHVDADTPIAQDGKDIPGPLTAGLTATRSTKGADGKDHQQRIAAIGDSDFLSNAFLGEQGNQTFGVSLIQWLAARDSQINIDIPKAPDIAMVMPNWAITLIVLFFVIVLPLALLGFGVMRWIVRRRK